MRINQSWGDKTPQHLFIASPSYSGEFNCHYVNSLLNTCDLLKQKNIPYTVYFSVYDSLVARSRNDLADKFLKSDATHILMIDADQGWEPEKVLKMLSYNDAFITGAVPGRKEEETYALRLKTTENRTPLGTDDGLLECDTNGVAFALIHRVVFEIIKKEGKYKNHEVYPYFQHKYGENGDHYGEDTYFVNEWQKHGKVWIYPDITFTHGPITANFKEYLDKQPRYSNECLNDMRKILDDLSIDITNKGYEYAVPDNAI